MTAEIGQLSLILALVIALIQAGAGLYGASRVEPALVGLARTAAYLQLLFILLGFAALTDCFLSNDFSVALVAQHSNAAQPLLYRLGATWGSHEGSMLLWVAILAVYGAAVAVFGGGLRPTLQARVLAVQALVGTAFIGFLLFTSNPFTRLWPAPADGAELNPVLQDPGLIFHPPVLYLGYVGFSMAFSFALAALIDGRVDASWARWVRPWVLTSWIFLTVGITAGSVWAYYTLGWGGWWFWDPVENASLMPWLLGTALLHSSLVLERRGAQVGWTLFLAILTFSISLVGTFLVRSGVLTSVHAFALDPRRGVYILAVIGVITGAALALYAWRAPALKCGALFAPLSRESGVAVNNLLLVSAAGTVFLGTFYPLFVSLLRNDSISVGPPYYHRTFGPIFILLLAVAGAGPMLDWRREELGRLAQRARWPLAAAGLVLVATWLIAGPRHLLAGLGLALGAWLVLGSAWIVARRWRMGSLAPLAVWGLVVAHAGLGVAAIGVTGVSTWHADRVLSMRPGQKTTLAGRTVRLEALGPADGPNFQAMRARFQVEGPLGVRELDSERRNFSASGATTTKAGIGVGLLGNVYISVGDANPDGSIVVRMWSHPLVDWIWAGCLMMAFGGVLSLCDRTLRQVTLVHVRRTRPAAAPAIP